MNCKNCDTKTIGAICHHCGQKTSTQRLTVNRFLNQHIVKKYLYFDQNFTSTLKDVLLKPGELSWNYINGKRKRYFNLVSLLGIIVVTYIFIETNTASEYQPDGSPYSDFVRYIEAHFNEIFFINMFVLALYSWLIFRRLKLNIIEHGVVSLVIVIGSGLIALMGNFVYAIGLLFYHRLADFPWPLEWLINILDLIMMLYIAFVYINFVGAAYSWWGKVWRIGFLFFLTGLTIVILFIIAIAIWFGGDLESINGTAMALATSGSIIT